jgi:hypothetical protein
LLGDLFGGPNFRKIEIKYQRLCACCRDGRCGFVEIFPIARHEGDGGKIPGEADRGCTSDTLAGSRDDGD